MNLNQLQTHSEYNRRKDCATMGTEHPDEIVLKVMELATKQFKLQMYDDCLRLFTRGIDYATSLDQRSIRKLRLAYKLTERPSYLTSSDQIHHPKLVALLDSRAATFEKLKKYNEALKDAGEIIEVEPYNVKGYLRLGKLYQLLNQDRKAFGAYVSGIKKITEGVKQSKLKVNEGSLDALRHQRSQLKTKILADEEAKENKKRSLLVPIPTGDTYKKAKTENNADRYDFFRFLPFEIEERILKLLPLKDVACCLRVCRIWNDIIGKMSLYNNISMRQLIGIKEIKSCYELINKSKKSQSSKMIRQFEINSIRRQEEKHVLLYVLTKAGVSISDILTLNFVDLTMEQIVDVIERSSYARNTLQELKSLKLKCVYVPTIEEKLFSLLPNIESIQLIPAPTTSIQPIPATSLSHQPPTEPFSNLKSLYLVGNKQRLQQLPFRSFFQEASLLPNLTSLIITGCSFQHLNQRNGNFNFLKNFKNLEVLIFENNEDFDFSHFFKNHDALEFPNLKKFVLREKKVYRAESLHPYDPYYIEKIFGNLKILDLTGSSINYNGLKKILKVCGANLKQLSIGFCQNIVHPAEVITSFRVLDSDFSYEEFVHFCPDLEVLYLNQSTDFTDHSLGKLIEAVRRYDGLTQLKVLDLSFNSGLSGYKLLELVKIRRLAVLLLNGIEIQASTIKYMEEHGYVEKVVSRPDQGILREYGLKSYDPLH